MRHIPNALTLANLLCGCLAVVALMQDDTTRALYFTAASMVFDFFDGLAARALGAYSPIGKELDSLADMVSFGLAPGLAIYVVLGRVTTGSGIPVLLAHAGFLVTLFSALRLAKFNTDSRQTKHFIGLPTPANAAWILPLAASSADGSGILEPLTRHVEFWLVFTLVSSALLVAEIPLFSLKFNRMGWKKNLGPIFLVITGIPLVSLLGLEGVPLIVLLYLILSLIFPPASENP